MPARIVLDENRLRELIEVRLLTQDEAAKVLCISVDTVRRRCRELGLKTQRTGPRSGAAHKGWKGGRRLVKGYVYIYQPSHPNVTKAGYVAEHRLVMEKKLGRYLDRNEVVHHLNDDPSDNRPENLELFSSNRSHLKETLRGKCPNWSPEGRARIAAGQRPRPHKRGVLPNWSPEGWERIQRGRIKRAIQTRLGIGVPQRNLRTGRFEARRDKSSQKV